MTTNSYNGFSGAQRTAAGRWAKAEREAGRRTRPTSCDACGQKHGLIEPHSEDYSGPPYGPWIGAFGLCYRCHMMVHCRFRAPEAFEAYVRELEAGAMYPPTGRSWNVIQAMLNRGHAAQLQTFPLEPVADRPQGGDPGLLRRIAAGEYRP